MRFLHFYFFVFFIYFYLFLGGAIFYSDEGGKDFLRFLVFFEIFWFCTCQILQSFFLLNRLPKILFGRKNSTGEFENNILYEPDILRSWTGKKKTLVPLPLDTPFGYQPPEFSRFFEETYRFWWNSFKKRYGTPYEFSSQILI